MRKRRRAVIEPGFCNPYRVRALDSCIPKTDLVWNIYGEAGRAE